MEMWNEPDERWYSWKRVHLQKELLHLSDTTAVRAGEVQLPSAYLRHALQAHTRCGHADITRTAHDQTQGMWGEHAQ